LASLSHLSSTHDFPQSRHCLSGQVAAIKGGDTTAKLTTAKLITAKLVTAKLVTVKLVTRV